MKGNKELKPFYKNLALWLVISLIMIMVFNVFNNPKTSQHDIIFSDFIELVNSGQIQEVTIQGHNISGHYGANTFKTYAPDDRSFFPFPLSVTICMFWNCCGVRAWPCRPKIGGRPIPW